MYVSVCFCACLHVIVCAHVCVGGGWVDVKKKHRNSEYNPCDLKPHCSGRSHHIKGTNPAAAVKSPSRPRGGGVEV